MTPEPAWAQSVRWLKAMSEVASDPACGAEWQARYAAAFERVREYIRDEYSALAEAEYAAQRAESAKASRPALRLVSARAVSQREEA